ncbi:hypothetical protein KOR42_24670 [Thalassoglobus neptunius]|uniref:Uncharacterized protein n=1 Tax=Thalassoglobus neptunius TaxID=1938619 RepID=A0A5C5X8B2_9PLAN|nr:hypothetical protein [Thalassoglobus neptunius]TWT59078.1 hypothetical protein KOR42_24670 [Thalassoglobus neptunius]
MTNDSLSDSNEQNATASDEPVEKSLSRPAFPRWLSSLVVTLAVAGMIYVVQEGKQNPSATDPDAAVMIPVGDNHSSGLEEASGTEIVSADAKPIRTADLVGTWILDDGIRRVITMQSDGTARMKVNFDFLTALRYGSELILDLNWSLEDNVLKQTIIDGKPESGRKTLVSDFGSSAAYRVLKMERGKLYLEELGTQPDSYTWSRSEDESL